MGKLGKKARKFAKKNLQSVLRQKRKTNASFKRKSSSKKGGHDTIENHVVNAEEVSNGRHIRGEDVQDTSLEAIFTEDDSDVVADASDSDGYLSEDLSCQHVTENGHENDLTDADANGISTLSMHNREIHADLTMQRKKLERLKKKDPGFGKYLESCNKDVLFQNEELYSDDDETINHEMQDGDVSAQNNAKLLTSSLISSWSKILTEDYNDPALISFLNAYRAACHYGTKSTDDASCPRIQNSDTFCNILTFMLSEADNIFRGLLKVSPSNCKKETILELKNTSKWKKLKPLVKSYLRSTLFLLNQVTDSEILTSFLIQLKASIIFFAAFPSLLRRLIEITVHLWATGGGALSQCSFLIIRDVADVFSFDTCLMKTYKAYIARCKVLEIVNIRPIEFLRNSFVELCSIDVHKSSSMALVSIQQLAKILQQGLQGHEDAIKKICSWEYANCIDLWVMFISANIRDYDIQPLCYMAIQLINGVANLFPGPRYFPLRLRCIQWLNKLSSSSGIFIPVTSFVLDLLEYKIGKEDGKPGKSINFPSLLKLPKHWLKSQKFREECVFSAIEMLSVHFSQWSYHISFPDLATIPLSRLKKFHEVTTIESLRRVVKRLIDQVEHNVEFVQKKRDELAFSPKDHQAVESFLQLEKGLNAPFTQYYKSVMEKASVRNRQMNEKLSFLEQKESKRKREQLPGDNDSVGGTKVDSMGKKRRALKV
ncbi:hypothetical protein LguiA_023589 [Lonicera macranthoides]